MSLSSLSKMTTQRSPFASAQILPRRVFCLPQTLGADVVVEFVSSNGSSPTAELREYFKRTWGRRKASLPSTPPKGRHLQLTKVTFDPRCCQVRCRLRKSSIKISSACGCSLAAHRISSGPVPYRGVCCALAMRVLSYDVRLRGESCSSMS